MSLIARFALIACLAAPAGTLRAEPIFPNSVVSNDLEFITDADPHVFRCLEFNGRDRREMPDKRGGELFADGTYVFTARFNDGTEVGIWAHRDFASLGNARSHVQMITVPLGQLPTVMRRKLRHVVLHRGDETGFGEDLGHFFVLYSENVKKRIRTHDIQETVFHEAVHATLDADHLESRAWRRAQQRDGGFVTQYAAEVPHREDMAESALFAYAMLRHPGRLPGSVEASVKRIMPNRLAFFRTIFIDSGPPFQRVGAPRDCAS